MRKLVIPVIAAVVSLAGATSAAAATTGRWEPGPGGHLAPIGPQPETSAFAEVSVPTSAAVRASQATSPKVVIGCQFNAEAPFFVTSSGPLYGQGSIGACTNPRPTECHLTVSLEHYASNGIANDWSPIATKDNGWTSSCTGRAQPSYKCAGFVAKKQYRTESTLSIVAPNGASDSEVVYSGSENIYCD